MEPSSRSRLIYFFSAIALVVLGLLSRHMEKIPAACGDALWAMMVFCCWRIILVKRLLKTVAIVALITSYLIEFSQILSFDWLVSLRSTFIGHMVLGQGFLWTDLLAYTIGIIIIYLVVAAIEKT